MQCWTYRRLRYPLLNNIKSQKVCPLIWGGLLRSRSRGQEKGSSYDGGMMEMYETPYARVGTQHQHEYETPRSSFCAVPPPNEVSSVRDEFRPKYCSLISWPLALLQLQRQCQRGTISDLYHSSCLASHCWYWAQQRATAANSIADFQSTSPRPVPLSRHNQRLHHLSACSSHVRHRTGSSDLLSSWLCPCPHPPFLRPI